MAQQVEHDEAAERVAAQIDVAPELGIALVEERVEPVHLVADGLHDGLAVDRARVEENVEERVVGEVPQLRDALERDDAELLVDARVEGRVPGDRQHLDAVHEALLARAAVVRLHQLQGDAAELVHCDGRGDNILLFYALDKTRGIKIFSSSLKRLVFKM